MVATRGVEEGPEDVFCVGGPAVTAELLAQLRSASALRKRISFPYDTYEEEDTMNDGRPASLPVNN